MARYIDADLLYKKLYPLDLVDKRLYSINAKAVADAIAKTPTADVVPRSEIDDFGYTFILGLLYECEPTKDLLDEFEKIVSKKVAMEIFEEIEKYVEVALMNGHIETPILCIGHGTFAELKKKYTEGMS